jgi:Histidine kinase-, DNA gyrase B-, and HSP90-like ATPase
VDGFGAHQDRVGLAGEPADELAGGAAGEVGVLELGGGDHGGGAHAVEVLEVSADVGEAVLHRLDPFDPWDGSEARGGSGADDHAGRLGHGDVGAVGQPCVDVGLLAVGGVEDRGRDRERGGEGDQHQGAGEQAALAAQGGGDRPGQRAGAGRPLHVTVAAGLPPVRASAAAIRQILGVLIANAAERGAGKVSIRARRAGNGLAVEVGDQGAGVAGDPELVFARRSGATPGRGIGLALARSLAGAEGGRLLLTHPGPQPVFSLLLPAAPESPALPGRAEQDDRSIRPSPR